VIHRACRKAKAMFGKNYSWGGEFRNLRPVYASDPALKEHDTGIGLVLLLAKAEDRVGGSECLKRVRVFIYCTRVVPPMRAISLRHQIWHRAIFDQLVTVPILRARAVLDY
jgi:hypothetical protein